MEASVLRPLFEPRSIAVVGASPNNSVALANLENPARIGYAGKVAGIHPRYEEVAGVPCAPRLSELDFVPEVIVVAVNRDRTVPVLEEAASLGVAGAMLFGIGFAEAGDEGRRLQDQVVDLAVESGMIVAGPNCQGLINFLNGVALYIEEVKPYEPGRVGLIAQSGSVATALINNRRGTRWRYAASTGNEAMVDAAAVLEYMVEDDGCDSICMFLESIRDRDRFFSACDRAEELDKPVIALKTGKTEMSMKAAEAHSGALAVPDRLVNALFQRHGVIRVNSLDEMLETANALQAGHRAGGARIATVAASGGQIQMALDAAAEAGLDHAELGDGTRQALAAVLPDFLRPENPLDYFGIEDEETNFPCLVEALAADPSVDAVITLVDQTDYPTGEGRFDLRLQTALDLADAGSGKLFAVLDGVGGVSPADRVEMARTHGVPLLSGFDVGMRALKHTFDFANRQREPRREISERPRPADPELRFNGAKVLSGSEALELLESNGIPIVQTRQVESDEEAVAAAERFGFPVVAKFADSSIAHKTELGGVKTGIKDSGQLLAVMAEFRAAGQTDAILQQQIAGTEMILGVTRHPELGSFLVIGLGGIWTEILDQAIVVPVGLGHGEAEAAIREIPGHEMLYGARGTAATAVGGLIEMIEKLDSLAMAWGDQISEMDINPVIANSEGVYAVDAVIMSPD